MSNELILLKSFCDNKDIYIKYNNYFNQLPNIEREIKLIYKRGRKND